MKEALDIRVNGVVQGVGFRPFVYRLAKRNLIDGWVQNGQDGVFIHAEGEQPLLDAFVLGIVEDAPAAACVRKVKMDEVPLQDCSGFEIRVSEGGHAEEGTLVSPDLAVCDQCLAELSDPTDKRYRYPFINCTNCGPRFTIIERLPYDRAATSMKRFSLCPECEKEYHDPLDRRFHAQPDACFACGPHMSFALPLESAGGESAADQDEGESWSVRWAATREESDAFFSQAVEMLLAGKIVAVKGLGGFHLACNAGDAQAVQELRRRKRRDGRAFAVMVPDVQTAQRYCHVSSAEKRALLGAQRPIVLLRKRSDAVFAAGLADKLPELGVMLPSTPVQHLLLADFAQAGGDMLVMTSGNVHDEPIVIDDGQALRAFSGIADALLGNDRAVLQRFDDSVLRVLKVSGAAGCTEAVQMIRRARGFAPQPIDIAPAVLPDAKAPAARENDILAVGPEQKNTFAFLRGSHAFVSQHIGDLEDAETFDAWLEAMASYRRFFPLNIGCVASDAHPSYLSTQWACEQEKQGIGARVEVQHHHAHVVSVMAENDLSEAVCGIAFDGTGFGADEAVWGGEVLLANTQTYERFMNFAYFPLPGGAAAIKNPLRTAYGVLWAFDLLEHPAAGEAQKRLGEQAAICQQMIDAGLNTPMTSSVGRLFDAASALLGLCDTASYEGEPAVLLEAALWEGVPDAEGEPDASGTPEGVPDASRTIEGASDASQALEASAALLPEAYSFEVVKNSAVEGSTALDTSVLLFDAAPAFAQLLDDRQAKVPVAVIARRFHDGMVAAIAMAARLMEALYGIRTVVLSGGVFMNRYLTEKSVALLQESGFTVAISKELPPNDGGLSLGQAVVAANRRNG